MYLVTLIYRTTRKFYSVAESNQAGLEYFVYINSYTNQCNVYMYVLMTNLNYCVFAHMYQIVTL